MRQYRLIQAVREQRVLMGPVLYLWVVKPPLASLFACWVTLKLKIKGKILMPNVIKNTHLFQRVFYDAAALSQRYLVKASATCHPKGFYDVHVS